ncbi:MAG: nucleotidyltransferase domain-containing protein [Acetobacteraceae bacterium]|nr:nucleotidyltransferase domain-containing protein [Acetobacteraceae bacterium]
MPTAPYPSYAELQRRELAAHRARALAAVREAAALAAARGARLVVFGSLAEGRFRRHSDLDLALEGPGEDLAELAVAIADAVVGHDIGVDVVRLDQAPPRLLARIREHGRDPAELE